MIYRQVIFGATVTVGVVRIYLGEISVRINTRARVVDSRGLVAAREHSLVQ